MLKVKYFILLLIMIYSSSTFGKDILKVEKAMLGEFIITVDHQTHLDYGLKYPVTYKFYIPEGSSDVNVYKKVRADQNWDQLEEKTTDDFFNAAEAVRFDYEQNNVYILVAFEDESDSIFIKIADNSGQIDVDYLEICKYYDNRQAVVTCSIDDYAEWYKDWAFESCQIFQTHHLWITMGIISMGCYKNDTWQSLQTLLDSGYTEAAAHSRTHPHIDEYDYDSEITGCKNDIISELDLPELFSKGENEYVYTWIAPYGEHDTISDSLFGENKFLVNRLYYADYDQIADWDSTNGLFEAIGMSGEMGNTAWPSSATTDTIELDARFDRAYQEGNVYHVMLHPQSINWQERYGWHHLEYISERKDVWYACVGHLYLYQYLQNRDYYVTSLVFTSADNPTDFRLFQNYPNPFNPSTTIPFTLHKSSFVTLRIYDILGREVETLMKEQRPAGNHTVRWNAEGFSSGIYFYQLKVGKYSETKKLILQK